MLPPNSIRSPKVKLDKIEVSTKPSENSFKSNTNKIIKKKVVIQDKLYEKKIHPKPFNKIDLKVNYNKF
jgi:hypothetical protein